MDKITGIHGVKNPYKKLNLVKHEKVRVKHLKEAAKLFDFDFKTKKRDDTMVENFFAKNSNLKILINSDTISPKQSIEIHDLVISDFAKFQKDIGVVTKASVDIKKNKSPESIKKDQVKLGTSITGLHLRNNFKKKALIPVGNGLKSFCKKNKVKIGVGVCLLSFAGIQANMQVSELKNSLGTNAANSAVDYRKIDETQNFILEKRELKGHEYQEFLDNLSAQTLTNDLKFKQGTDEFRDFNNLYGEFILNLQEQQGNDKELRVTQRQGEAFLKMNYIATNSYIDILKDRHRGLVDAPSKANELELAKYSNQLSTIKYAISDINADRGGDTVRIINSGKNMKYTYKINDHGDFVILGLEKRKVVITK